MLEKTKVTGLSAVVVIYRKDDPRWIYCEFKDDGYPNFPNTLCLIGGNWVGEVAKKDGSPLGTLRREIDEELVILKEVKEVASSEEARKHLLYQDAQDRMVRRKAVTVRDKDTKLLVYLKGVISDNLIPFGEYLQKVPGWVPDKFEVGQGKDCKSRKDHTGLCCYYECGLAEGNWQRLVGLRQKFGRLSNESQDGPWSVEQIVRRDLRFCWGHDQVVQAWFISKGVFEAMEMPIIDDIVMDQIRKPLDSYDKYLLFHEFQKHPFLEKK